MPDNSPSNSETAERVPRRRSNDPLLSRSIAPLVLAAALVVVLFSAVLTYRNVQTFSETARWVAHTREVLTTIKAVSAALSQAESAGRGFWLSGNPRYRDEFNVAFDAALAHQADLQRLTADNPAQQRRLTELNGLIVPALNQLRLFITARDAIAADRDEEARMLAATSARMQPVERLVAEFKDHEDQLLAKRTAEYDQRLRQTRWTLLVTSLVASGLVLAAYYILRRHWNLQQTSADETATHLREKGTLARYNQRLLESTGEGIYGVDNLGRCTFINKAGASWLGGQPKDFLGKDMHQLIHYARADGQPYAVEECPIYTSSHPGGGCRVDNEVFWRLDGNSFPVEYSSFPIHNRGVIEGSVVTFRDIEERLKAQEELKAAKEAAEMANESKSQFLANMSHELRTPLNAVIMYSELLAEEAEDQDVPQFIPDLQRIRSAGNHLLELVNGVLDLSKIEAGKMELYCEEFDVREMLNDVVKTIEPMVEKNNNRLEIEIADGVTTMDGDVTKLRQVLLNLLSNSAKFTEAGTIRVRVAPDDAHAAIVFQVIDAGIGMTQQQVSRLFQPFMQADASTTRKYGGTGLGLAIIKRFTELMQGEVHVDSKEGVGTTFTVTLPQRLRSTQAEHGNAESDDAEPQSTVPMVDAIEQAAHASGVVLVIDDDPAIRDILTRVLTNEGIRSITAKDGAEGLRMAREHRPDLIILDVAMPKIDGWSVLLSLKSDDELADIPVIIQSISDDRDLGFVLGASEYLVKPVDRTRLVSLLRRYVRHNDASILIVDDDDGIRRVIARNLNRQGWQVVEACNGAEALVAINAQPPAAILLDLMMPVMDGLEFLELFRANSQWSEIPVIVMTSKELTTDDRQRLSGGIERVLIKGNLSREKLLDEVRRIVANVAQHSNAL